MTLAELKSMKLDQIASEYRRRGYDVVIHPGVSDVLPFLAPFSPDLVAMSSDDNAVVQVRSSPEVSDDSLVRLAEVIEAQPNWRFDLVIVNPYAAEEVPKYTELADDDRVESLLQEAASLKREGRFEAAAVIAWSAAEAIIRKLTRAAGLDVERRSSLAVLKELHFAGMIDDDQYSDFTEVIEFRNAFAHGFAARAEPEIVDRIIRDVMHLRAGRAA